MSLHANHNAIFTDYEHASPEVRAQIDRVMTIWHEQLPGSVAGIYLHGSMCLGRFVEGASDVDILVVTKRRIAREERLSIARAIIAADRSPSPLEMSAVWQEHLVPWRHPMPCQFHYSDAWTEHYRALLDGREQKSDLVDEDFVDPDIACYARVMRQSGICLYGQAADRVFPIVPEEDFWQSISADIDAYDFHAYDPRYLASNIISLGRILSYKVLGRILSKYDAALWTLTVIPSSLHGIIENATDAWYLAAPLRDVPPEELEALRRFLIDRIKDNA